MVVVSAAAKSALHKSMAARCIAGEFDGSASLAAKDPECIALGVARQNIQYYIDQVDPAGSLALARAADRGRVAAKAVGAPWLLLLPAYYIYVECGWTAPVAAAASKVKRNLESGID